MQTKMAVTLTRDELFHLLAALTTAPPEWAGDTWPPHEMTIYLDPANVKITEWSPENGLISVDVDHRRKRWSKYKRQVRGTNCN